MTLTIVASTMISETPRPMITMPSQRRRPVGPTAGAGTAGAVLRVMGFWAGLGEDGWVFAAERFKIKIPPPLESPDPGRRQPRLALSGRPARPAGLAGRRHGECRRGSL